MMWLVTVVPIYGEGWKEKGGVNLQYWKSGS